MHKILVVNKNVHAPTSTDIYVGRGSVLGNPYTSKDLATSKAIYQVNSKEEAIRSYREYLSVNIATGNNAICDELNNIYTMALKGEVHLVCYCKPKDCHGDIIKDIVTAKLIKHYMKNGKK